MRVIAPGHDETPSPGHRAARAQTLATLYEKGKRQQWDGATALDWTMDGPLFGDKLPDDSSFAAACFDASPLARYGSAVWNAFRWEFQSWMVSQFLPGEHAAMIAAARLVEIAPDSDARLCLATQV